MGYDASEQDVVNQVFADMLRDATGDGGKKRAAGLKPPWWKDDAHEAATYSHRNKWKHGETADADSGAHPLVHEAWRLLAIAYQERYGKRDPRETGRWGHLATSAEGAATTSTDTTPPYQAGANRSDMGGSVGFASGYHSDGVGDEWLNYFEPIGHSIHTASELDLTSVSDSWLRPIAEGGADVRSTAVELGEERGDTGTDGYCD